MKIRIAILSAAAALIAALAVHAGTGTVAAVYGSSPNDRHWISLSSTSTAAGVAETNIHHIAGGFTRIVIVPSSGATVPVGGFSVLLKDPHGIDAFGGLGASLTSNTTVEFFPAVTLTDGVSTSVIPRMADSTFTFTVTNAGASRAVDTYIYWK